MICPKCHKEIDKVWVISESQQPCHLEGDTLGIYGMVEVGKTLRIECWNCNKNISEFIKEICPCCKWTIPMAQ
jgi:hypothetical protein